MKKTLVLVADSARARLFNCQHEQFQDMKHVTTWHHDEGRLHEGDIIVGSKGAVSSNGQSLRETGPSVSATEHEADVFAKELAMKLRDARTANECDKIVLVAAPAFLGKLRDRLDKPTHDIVSHSLDKDLSRHPAEEIAELVNKHLG